MGFALNPERENLQQRNFQASAEETIFSFGAIIDSVTD